MEERKEADKESEVTDKELLEDDETNQIYAGQPRLRSAKRMPFLLGIGIIILILGGVFYFFRGSGGETKVSPTPTESPFTESEPTPIASTQASFDRSKYTLRVLNGTKTQGLAASTSAKLKDLGYKIEKTANATNSAFLKTVVRVKPDFEELLENLLKDLSGLDLKGEEGSELKEEDSADGEIILGSQ